MEFCIFHGNSFQNGFPEFAHILHVEFLTVMCLTLLDAGAQLKLYPAYNPHGLGAVGKGDAARRNRRPQNTTRAGAAAGRKSSLGRQAKRAKQDAHEKKRSTVKHAKLVLKYKTNKAIGN